MCTKYAAQIRRGRTAAAPPTEMQRRSRLRPGRSNQSDLADMLTVSTQNMLSPGLSNLQSSSSSLQPSFRFSSNFLVHARRAALVIHMNIHVNIHVNIYMNILINIHMNIYMNIYDRIKLY